MNSIYKHNFNDVPSEKGTLAFCIFKYFPHGGLQRDFLCTALECKRRGYDVIIYTRFWQGDVPQGITVKVKSSCSWTNHGKATEYAAWVQQQLEEYPVLGVIGFNCIPGLDIYFAGDNCFAARAKSRHRILYHMCSRYKTYYAMEKSVFEPSSKTSILFLTNRQKMEYIENYGTPDDRFFLIPPGVLHVHKNFERAKLQRLDIRASLGCSAQENVLILVGSDFKAKGVERAIKALSALPDDVCSKTKLWIVGDGNIGRYVKLSKRLDVQNQVIFLGGRDDVPMLLGAADLMVHPALNEATGTVLLEAMVAGLPVLCTEECGYASIVEKAEAGRVVAEPFLQQELNRCLLDMLTEKKLSFFRSNGLKFVKTADIYCRHLLIADIIEQSLRAT
jgi:UDP-glucose:(heptosyl)LPS alpha-1,3-glucosyltransferase